MSNVDDEIDKIIAKYRMGFVVGDKDITTYYMDFKKELTTLLEQAEKKAKIEELKILEKIEFENIKIDIGKYINDRIKELEDK